MHYILIVVVIAGIVIWQFLSFINNRKKLSTFENIFPAIQSKFELIKDDKTNAMSFSNPDIMVHDLKRHLHTIHNYWERTLREAVETAGMNLRNSTV